MIISVTANTTLDQTLFIESFVPNRTIKAADSVWSMGGKPTDASWILGELGVPSLALGFAAGPLGQRVEAMLQVRGVQTDFIWVEGESRLNTVIISQNGDHTTITTDSLRVSSAHLDILREKYHEALMAASCVVIGGSLPTGITPPFYAEFVGAARQRNIPVIFDAADANLKAGLTASPTYIKPNRDELSAVSGSPVRTLEAAGWIGRSIFEQYGTMPIITLGGEGALAVLPDRAYHIPPLKVDVVSTAGAGDAVLAGIAASIERGQPIEEGLRLGFAIAGAVLLQPGTADCRREDVERLLPQVQLLPFQLSISRKLTSQ